MKLSGIAAKLTCLKGKAVRVLTTGLLAGAVLTAAPAAKAQRFAIGVQIGGPRYVAPAPVGPYYGYGYGYAPGYWERRRIEEERARAAYIRHQEWQRYHQPYGYGYSGYRRPY